MAKAKKPAKKSSKSDVIDVTVRKKILGKAPEEKHFILHDGKKLGTIYELIDELETMEDGIFKHYVHPGVNHFANWIEDVFEERSLAENLRKVERRIEAQKTILSHLLKELNKLAHKKGK